MAERKNYRNGYVYGTAARELAEPSRKEFETIREHETVQRRRNLSKEEQREQLKKHYAQENIRKASKIGALYTLFIAAAVGVTFFVCAQYIMIINQGNEQSSRIVALQEEYNAIREENDQKKLSIDTAVDYNYIYDVATKELGMIHAGSEHVVKYESGESEYVIQYTDVLSGSNK